MFIPEEELGENYLLEHQCSRQQGVTLIKVDFDPAQRKSSLPVAFQPDKRFHSCFSNQNFTGNYSCFYIGGFYIIPSLENMESSGGQKYL